tara:strand:+ start:1095 stop:1286 length:192 start_codon:yes stop_codon:yes gene_type:complete
MTAEAARYRVDRALAITRKAFLTTYADMICPPKLSSQGANDHVYRNPFLTRRSEHLSGAGRVT